MEYIELIRKSYGLDKPLYEQLFVYIGKVMTGDLGYSYWYREPVLDIITTYAPNTLLLMATQLILATIFGVILGVVSSSKQHSKIGPFTSFVSLAGYSIPVFWLAQMCMLVFALRLNWFPVQGMKTIGVEMTWIESIGDVLHHLALPVLTMVVWQLAVISRLTRASMLEVLNQNFITLARSKGLDEKTVVYKHALRNALRPVITVTGLNIGMMFTGAILTETVFAWPGIGRLMFNSIFTRDYPILMGVFVAVSIMVISANLIVDIMYAFLDPRVRYG